MNLLTDDLIGYANKFLPRYCRKLWRLVTHRHWQVLFNTTRVVNQHFDIQQYPPHAFSLICRLYPCVPESITSRLQKLKLYHSVIDFSVTLPNLEKLCVHYPQTHNFSLTCPTLSKFYYVDTTMNANISEFIQRTTTLCKLLVTTLGPFTINLDLSEHSRLTHLYCDLSPRNPINLNVNPNLLCLAVNTNIDIAHLTDLTDLSLDLETFSGMLPVASNLRRVNLNNNPFKPNPILYPIQCQLREFLVSEATISDYDPVFCKIEVLRCRCLHVMYLTLTNLTVSEYSPTITRLTNLAELCLYSSPEDMDLSGLVKLTKLNLHTATSKYPSSLKELTADGCLQPNSLINLNLETLQANVNERDLDSLTNLTTLTTRDASAEVLINITKLANLCCLDLIGLESIIPDLSILNRLRKLKVSCAHNHNLSHISKLTNLSELEIALTNRITFEAAVGPVIIINRAEPGNMLGLTNLSQLDKLRLTVAGEVLKSETLFPAWMNALILTDCHT